MNRFLTIAALALTAGCSQQQQPAPPANDVAATSAKPVAPAAKAAIPSLKGAWKVAGANGLTATFTGAQLTLAEGCTRRAWSYSQHGNTVAFKSAPGASSNCGQPASAALGTAFSELTDANLAVFGADGRTVMLSGLGGTLQLERR